MSSGELQQIKVDSIQYRQFHLNKENIDKEAAQRLRQAEARLRFMLSPSHRSPARKKTRKQQKRVLGCPGRA